MSASQNWKPIVRGPLAKVNQDHMVAQYDHNVSQAIQNPDGTIDIKAQKTNYQFRVSTKVPRVGIMLVGLGGNNGTTFTAGVLANKLNVSWMNKHGEMQPNWYGSITQCSTTKVGIHKSEEIFAPLNHILPLVKPDDLIIGGWDISKMNLGDAMKRAEVLDWDLQEKLRPMMKDMVPLPAVYYEDFIALNQKSRADNIVPGNNKLEHLERIRNDIRTFKDKNNCDKVLVLWTANTERCCKVTPGVHDSTDNLMKAICQNHKEISPSIIYAMASILEGCSFINGSPQNTLVDGVIELADEKGVFVVGDDFKSGQTKMKTCLADFLVSVGIKLKSVISYNHLGNNDGKNLSSAEQFKSKELSKKSCVDDILQSNPTLYKKGEHIDHEVVIKYLPAAGDSKKALDEYSSEIFLGGKHVISLYNVCEDSLLAAPIILDLLLITEIMERVEWKTDKMKDFKRFDTVLTALGYLTKAPKTRDDAPLINSLFRQRNGIENLFKVCAGLPLEDNMLLEFRAQPTV